MTVEEQIILIEKFKNGLLSKATDGNITENEYKEGRTILLSLTNIKDIVPRYIKTCSTSDDFRREIQSKCSNYKGRREIITDDFKPIIERMENQNFSAVDNININLGKELDNGGYGRVYVYKHDLLDMDFAVKVLDPLFADETKNADYEKRFLREAKIMFQLFHPNIARIYDVGRIKNRLFIRMEYIEGENLNDKISDHSTLDFESSKKIIIELLKGLTHAHSKSIIHRDLKPSNIMISHAGEIKIIDFGISAYVELEGHTKLTPTGEHISGGIFIDPLLIENPKLRDIRSDIYSIGAIWYYMLIGIAPYGSDMRDKLKKSTSLKEEELSIIMKCLSSDINSRYNNCAELLNMIL